MSDILRHETILDHTTPSFYELFAEQIFQATGIMPELILSDNKIFDVDVFYKLCHIERNREGWIKISSGHISSEAQEYLKKCCQDSFIIGYHANPAMLKVFDTNGIVYIDFYEGSLRFMEDLHFEFRSNSPEIAKQIFKHKMPEPALYLEARRLKACYAAWSQPKLNIEPNSLLICGQTEVDISLVKNDKIVSWMTVQDKLNNVIKQYDHIYYKPHPYCNSASDGEKYVRSLPNISLINDNFYKIVSNPNIKAVAALSSGVLHESEYFRKNVHVLSHKYTDHNKDEKNIDLHKFIVVNNDFYSPTFWADILSPVFKINQVIEYHFANNINFLRANLANWWGYEIACFATKKELSLLNSTLNQELNSTREEIQKDKEKRTFKNRIYYLWKRFF